MSNLPLRLTTPPAAALEVSPPAISANTSQAPFHIELGAGCPQSGLTGPGLTSRRVQSTGSIPPSASCFLPSLLSPVPARPLSGPKSSSCLSLPRLPYVGPRHCLLPYPLLRVSSLSSWGTGDFQPFSDIPHTGHGREDKKPPHPNLTLGWSPCGLFLGKSAP